jgi:hypothetical protein
MDFALPKTDAEESQQGEKYRQWLMAQARYHMEGSDVIIVVGLVYRTEVIEENDGPQLRRFRLWLRPHEIWRGAPQAEFQISGALMNTCSWVPQIGDYRPMSFFRSADG